VVGIWQLNSNTVSALADVGNAGSQSHLARTADFDDNRSSDLLWFGNDRAVSIWQMNSTHLASAAQIGSLGAGWHYPGAGDFEGNGGDGSALA
jgi:hypothetical protein